MILVPVNQRLVLEMQPTREELETARTAKRKAKEHTAERKRRTSQFHGEAKRRRISDREQAVLHDAYNIMQIRSVEEDANEERSGEAGSSKTRRIGNQTDPWDASLREPPRARGVDEIEDEEGEEIPMATDDTSVNSQEQEQDAGERNWTQREKEQISRQLAERDNEGSGNSSDSMNVAWSMQPTGKMERRPCVTREVIRDEGLSPPPKSERDEEWIVVGNDHNKVPRITLVETRSCKDSKKKSKNTRTQTK
jgi:hypothetical protein